MRALAGTRALAGLTLRRDRIRLLVWVLLAAGIVAGTASSLKGLYVTLAERQQYAKGVGANPASAVLGGPGFGLPTLGGITVAEMGSTLLTLVALASILLVVRYTRTEEETGRAELVGSAVVGRQARLAAALLVVGGADLVIAAATITALIGYGLPVAGSLAFGLAVAGTGWVFAAVAAVAAQVVEHARTADGSAAAVFGLAFILRAVGDASGAAHAGRALTSLSWLSPIGWAQQVRPYGGERWWVLGLLLGASVVLLCAAVALGIRRDIGAGLIPARPGHSKAARSLASAWALAWRLQRGSLIGWTVGIAVGAGVFGAIAHDIDGMVVANSDAARVFVELGGSRTLVDSYLAWMLGLTGIAAAAYAVGAVLRLRSEETGLRAEPVLATAVTRWQWAASHLGAAVVGIVVMLLTTGLVVGVIHGLRGGDIGHELPTVLAGALVQGPAALVVAGVAIALFGLAPRLSTTAWLVVVAALLIGQLGGILRLNRWVTDLSPFTHVPRVPGHEVTATPLIWLTAVATLLTVAGLIGFRRRDLT
jgi:polyether ionophore transport system permease protein